MIKNTKHYINGMTITIYQNFEGETAMYYLRICTIQTKLFPHGVVLGDSSSQKSVVDWLRTQYEEALGLVEMV
jgi:hypothetical protein